jgi:hypothetical protein
MSRDAPWGRNINSIERWNFFIRELGMIVFGEMEWSIKDLKLVINYDIVILWMVYEISYEKWINGAIYDY